MAFGEDRECPTCGGTHPPCTMCGSPTRCPPDELGEPFSMCDACDEKMAMSADAGVPHGPSFFSSRIAKIAKQIIRDA